MIIESKFNIGDKVRFKRKYSPHELDGIIGRVRIISFDSSNEVWYSIGVDEHLLSETYKNKHNLRSNANHECLLSPFWDSDIELVEQS